MYLFLFLIGSSFGSFITCYAYRYKFQSFMSETRSFCDNCHQILKPWHLVPIFSFIFLKGRCTYCKQPISFFSTLIEMLTGLFFVLTFTPADYPTYIFRCFLFVWLLLISLQDIQTKTVSSNILYLGGLCILIFKVFYSFNFNLIDAFLIVPFIIFLLIMNYIEKLGSADTILITIFFCSLGFLSTLFSILIASITAIIYIIILKKHHQIIAFIPFLSFGGLIMHLITIR